MLLSFIAAVATAAAIYFIVNWFSVSKLYRSMTPIEKANAQIEQDQANDRKQSIAGRLSAKLREYGYEGSWTPILLVVILLYALLVVILKVVGIGSIIGAIIALPAAVVVAVAALNNGKRRQKEAFRVQLMQALGLIATQLEAGDGTRRAIEKTIGLVEDPLKSELTRALDSVLGTGSLVEAMKNLAERYPSRAMNLFIAALEVDDKMGTRLAPALRQAQKVLEKDFELSAEARAEITEARGEFFGISAILGFVAVSMIGSAQGISKEVYTSPLGLILIALTGANYLFGVYRAMKIFQRVKGND